MRPIHWLLMVLAAFGWASGGIATRAALNEGVGEWTMVAMRIVIASVILIAVVLFQRLELPSRTVLGYGVVQATFNVLVPYVLFTFAYGEASAGFVGLFAALIPIATAVAANFMLPDEPLTLPKFIGLFVAFLGVAALLLSGDSGLSEGGRPLVAAGLALISVSAVGFAGAFGRRHAGEYEPVMMTTLQLSIAAVVLLVLMFGIEGAPSDVGTLGWVLIVEMALFATAMPFFIIYWLYERISATNASLVGYMVPFIVLIGGVLILDEQIQTGIILGGALVLAGIVLAERDSRRIVEEDVIERPGV